MWASFNFVYNSILMFIVELASHITFYLIHVSLHFWYFSKNQRSLADIQRNESLLSDLK